MYQEKNEAIGTALKRNNSLETCPYATQKHVTMYQSVIYTCKYPVKSLKDQCKLVSEEVKKTLDLRNSKNEF